MENNNSQNFQTIDEEGRTRTDISKNKISIEIYGNEIKNNNKETDSLRIGFININGIPSFNSHAKNNETYQAMLKNKMDVMGFAEINKNWDKIEENHQWRQRTRHWWEAAKTSMSFNSNDCSSSDFQPGGTIVTAINRAAHRVRKVGRDKSGLGRWSWLRFRGKNNITMVIISAYRPCKPSRQSAGTNTTYAQHIRYLDAMGDDRNPRQAFLEDLAEEIESLQGNADQIILMMDCNEDIQSETIQTWLDQNQLTEAISTMHQGSTAPATYHRGTKQIDGIFISATINPIRSGFLPFGEFPSDHRCLWLDITYANAFGCKMEPISIPSARRLKCDDPRVRKKWQKELKTFIQSREIHSKMFNIESNIY